MSLEIQKRIFTSLILMFILIISLINQTFLFFSLFIFTILILIEFHNLIDKVYYKKIFIVKIKNMIIKFLLFTYVIIFSIIIYSNLTFDDNTKAQIIFIFIVCFFSDIGGFVIGKSFKGKKLSKISPNKTISGSCGSFLFALTVPFIFNFFHAINLDLFIIFYTLLISFMCQTGDLIISFLKRKAKIKDTGNILPGHGGILDRVDGILLAVPTSMIFLILIS